uniref:Uncharacterized protein n=1 Tax=Myotis myotis TaxID=51298 RepID=A0A7J7R424_MYOMY|nr:hypothetical protein mMyoMyo1_010908 [Myotis myotis]
MHLRDPSLCALSPVLWGPRVSGLLCLRVPLCPPSWLRPIFTPLPLPSPGCLVLSLGLPPPQDLPSPSPSVVAGGSLPAGPSAFYRLAWGPILSMQGGRAARGGGAKGSWKGCPAPPDLSRPGHLSGKVLGQDDSTKPQ